MVENVITSLTVCHPAHHNAAENHKYSLHKLHIPVRLLAHDNFQIYRSSHSRLAPLELIILRVYH